MIEWNDGLNLGIKTLDNDHKKLLEIINSLSGATNDEKTRYILERIFIDLEKYALEHCQREEVILKKCNYEQLDVHTSQHRVFTNKVAELKKKFLTSKESVSAQELSIFLSDWLFNHIIEEDIPTITTFERCGLIDEEKTENSFYTNLLKRATNTFSFTKRILISAVIPLIGMFILIFIILWSNYNKHEEIKKTSSITYILPNVNELAHVIQIERGLSCGYLSSSKNKFKDSLQKQRKIVNNTVELFTHKLNTIHSGKLIAIRPLINIFKEDIETLKNIRIKVNDKKISQADTIDFYTNLISNILSITSKMTLFNLDRKVTSSISTLSSLLYYKEILGQKRACGTMVIEKKGATTEEYVEFMQLLGNQETFLNNFSQTATKGQKDYLKSIMTSDITKKIALYEERIKNHDFEKIDSVVWFELTTELINRIKLFEDQLLYKIDVLIKSGIDSNVKNLFLWLVYTIAIFIVTIFIIYIFEQSSKKELYQFTNAMNHLAQGGRSLRLPLSSKKDEISQMYAAYEITRQKLLKGDIYAQLYSSQKELEIQEKEKQNIKLEEMASIDPLTNCVNRRKFTELSSLELERATRYQSDLSFLMLDIDHFKAVNDTYGHGVGDEVLKHFSSICLDMARALDVVARIGGEEFVVMLPETNSEGAYIFAERFREKIFNSEVNIENQTIKYSVSIGISILNAPNDKDVKTILERADKALYKAKGSGRNMSIIY